MNSLSRLCIFLASLFGVMAIFPILWLYLSFEDARGVQFPEGKAQPSMVKTVADATDIESLRRVCNLLAVSTDNDRIVRHAATQALDNIRSGGIKILLGWSAIAIAGFLYVAWRLQRLSKANGSVTNAL